MTLTRAQVTEIQQREASEHTPECNVYVSFSLEECNCGGYVPLSVDERDALCQMAAKALPITRGRQPAMRLFRACAGCERPWPHGERPDWVETGHVRLGLSRKIESATWCPDCDPDKFGTIPGERKGCVRVWEAK